MSLTKDSCLRPFNIAKGQTGQLYSLPELEKRGYGKISRLPVCIRIVLESLLRNLDGKRVDESHIKALAQWKPTGERIDEIPFLVARVLLQDFTGVPLGVDLAAMRSAVARIGKDPSIIEPLVPVDLVIDHSIQVDFSSRSDAMKLNMDMEFKRNQSRYQFLKWCMDAFNGFSVVPPGIGICHQVNLEYLGKVVIGRGDVYYPDTLVGTDSHTTMINGLGVVGWGVGGIEAEAGMLGQPVYFLTPDVVGVELSGSLQQGVTATDLVLRITELLRQAKVVGKFVEFHGEGAASLPVTDRATIGNMAPEYGATIGFFPIDERTCEYLTATGRDEHQISIVKSYYSAQQMFGIPKAGECDYSSIVKLDLSSITPSVAGPKRPQDRIDLAAVKARFTDLLVKPSAEGGYGKNKSNLDIVFSEHTDTARSKIPQPGGGKQDSIPESKPQKSQAKDPVTLAEIEMANNRPTPDRFIEAVHDDEKTDAILGEFPPVDITIKHGDILIAAITSCTNTSNPSVMIAAGLLAKKAVARGLHVNPKVKTSLAPGSRVVSKYLEKAGLQSYLNQLGFNLVGYGCTTCIGNSGPLDPEIEELVTKNDVIAASVLSGNRNFEARVHQSIKANFLMSPPLVVAYALAGSMQIDLQSDPLGKSKDGKEIYLRDIWPSLDEIEKTLAVAFDADTYKELYRNFKTQNAQWNDIPTSKGVIYDWDKVSTYIQEPPYFENFSLVPTRPTQVRGARALAIFGDSITTDHISPAGAIKASSPAGVYLQQHNIAIDDFNSYGARRGNHQVMVRGTFANVRIRNLMVPGVEGGITKVYPGGETLPIYDASLRYQSAGIPLIIFAGQEYGTGSSRDWAAKGTRLLGVRAVVAQSFERIHRSNLVGMGVLPCQFRDGTTVSSLGLTGSEIFEIRGLEEKIVPRQTIDLIVTNSDDKTSKTVPLTLRIDTPIEVDYYTHGGIMPYVLRQLASRS